MFDINIDTITKEQIKNLTIEDIRNYKTIGKQTRRKETLLFKLCYYNNKIINKEIIEILKDEIGICDIENNSSLLYYLHKNTNVDIEIIKLLEKEIEIKNMYSVLPLDFYLMFNENPDIEIIDILTIEFYVDKNGNYVKIPK